MSVRVAIVGSRDYPELWRIIEYIQALRAKYPGTLHLVTGDAWGTDEVVRFMATAYHIPCTQHRVDFKRSSPQRYYERNARIATDNLTFLTAFWHDESGDTKNTMQQAKRAGVPVTWFDADGKESRWAVQSRLF